MGFLKKIKKAVKKVAKVAIKTAPVWSSFVPGGGFAMTLVRQGLKLKGAAAAARPSVKNRFPLPNPLWQGGPSVTRARALARVPVRRGRTGPFAAPRGQLVRMSHRANTHMRGVTLVGRAKKQAHMRRMMM